MTLILDIIYEACDGPLNMVRFKEALTIKYGHRVLRNSLSGIMFYKLNLFREFVVVLLLFVKLRRIQENIIEMINRC